MTQVVFQPQKCKFEDFITPIHSFKGKGKPEEEFAKAVFFTGILLPTKHDTQ